MTSPRFPLPLCVRRLRALARWALASGLALGSGFAAAAPKKTYDLPADTAERSIKLLATQSGAEVLYSSNATRAVRTNAVRGRVLRSPRPRSRSRTPRFASPPSGAAPIPTSPRSARPTIGFPGGGPTASRCGIPPPAPGRLLGTPQAPFTATTVLNAAGARQGANYLTANWDGLTHPDGSIISWRIKEPQRWTLTNTFTF